jgi:hypothetical protein
MSSGVASCAWSFKIAKLLNGQIVGNLHPLNNNFAIRQYDNKTVTSPTSKAGKEVLPLQKPNLLFPAKSTLKR